MHGQNKCNNNNKEIETIKKTKSTIELMNIMTEQKRLGCHIQNSEEKLKLYLAKQFFRGKR